MGHKINLVDLQKNFYKENTLDNISVVKEDFSFILHINVHMCVYICKCQSKISYCHLYKKKFESHYHKSKSAVININSYRTDSYTLHKQINKQGRQSRL